MGNSIYLIPLLSRKLQLLQISSLTTFELESALAFVNVECFRLIPICQRLFGEIEHYVKWMVVPSIEGISVRSFQTQPV
jgi:hypothetical protein